MNEKLIIFVSFVTMFMVACNAPDPDPILEPTEEEKQMIPAEMSWRLDSMLVISNYQSLKETSEMIYPGDNLYQVIYTFYPYTYRFPSDLCFVHDFDHSRVYLSTLYDSDFCKYICTYGGEIVAGGYLCYYRDLFCFSGTKKGAWIDFMLRETTLDWDADVWTLTYNAEETDNGEILTRCTEYYSKVK
jgi:hypothetical protein